MQVVVNPMRPVCIAMDFGRTPTALVGQVDVFGRYLIFEELVTEDMGLHQFCVEKLKPRLMAEPYVGKRHYVVADPAGNQRSQLSEENAFEVLKQHGFVAYPAPTNDIQPRLLAVEKLLRQNIMGEPAIQISREGCPTLIRALAANYRYRKKTNGQLEDKPEKNEASHVADALQYGCLSVSADLASRMLRRIQPRTQTPRFTSAAWT
jgi:hypothetical protein